ncbi:MAG TPA: DUF5691 domain-containing protein [Ktedonobacterales bacterium]|nr:DUF5691 domain-containing protein [Ktedonobacterales bacterium]
MTTTDRITNAALIGSARAPVGDALPPATPEGALIGSLTDANPEQRLLLAAGVRAIYRMAGYTPERLDAPLEPAPAETKAVCSANVADLIHQLLIARASDLLQEALQRMIAAGLILPPEMLPLALGSATVAQRPLMAQVAGERGAWLGGFNSAWSWVRESLAHSLDEMPADADTIWQEGTSADRIQVIARWRATDPAKARDEIVAVWRQEKADFRVELIETLATNLSADDEALLETALDDRSSNVRAVALRLLARIPDSAYRARAIARADVLLNMGKKKLVTTLPEAHEKSWERDGIAAKTRQGVGERSWWLMQTVAVTPLAHWVERFSLSPTELIAAATDEHGVEVLEGWSRAAVLYDASDWIQPLVEAWSKRLGKRASGGISPLQMSELCEMLLPKLPLPALEAMARKILRNGESKQEFAWETLVAALPRPWSAGLAREWLAGLRAFARDELASLKSYAPDWRECSEEHAMLLPAECLDEALSPWEMDEYANNRWQANSWRELHDQFLKAVRQRQRIRDEIPGERAP